MSPGQLVKAVAIALDVPIETVIQHDRNLAVAGLRTSGARGRNAPDVTPLDAARLLVATLGSDRTKDSAETVKEFERARYIAPLEEKEGADIIRNLSKGHNLIDGLAAIIAEASRPIDDLRDYLRRFSRFDVGCSSARGFIRGNLGSAGYEDGDTSYVLGITLQEFRDLTSQELHEPEYWKSGISQTRHVDGSAVMMLGAAFRDNGLRYANALEAYRAGYGAAGVRKAPAKSKKKGA